MAFRRNHKTTLATHIGLLLAIILTARQASAWQEAVTFPVGDEAATESGRLFTDEEVRAIVQEELAKQPPSAAAPAANPLGLNVTWDKGLTATSADKAFKVHVGGRTQFDTTWYQAESNVESAPGGLGKLEDAANFRRARLRVDGVMYEVIEWAAEYDFINQVNDEPTKAPTNGTSVNVPALTDLWVNIGHLPVVGNLKIGNFKEPIGLEHLTSSRWLDFMERSYLQDAFFGPFNNGFSPGAMIYNWTEDELATASIGVFKNTSNIFGSGIGDGEYAVTGRLTMLPFYEDDGERLLHLGLAGSNRDLDNDTLRIRSRGSLRAANPGPFNPVLADTGVFSGDDQTLLAAELLWIDGPWQVQSEFTGSVTTNTSSLGIDRGSMYHHGWYAEVLCFLTGEHRPYNRRAGAPDRIIPHSNFHPGNASGECGWGAWQVGTRYSYLDLRDSGINGGIIHDVTFGLNWFLNPNMKLQWNYVIADRNAAGTAADGLIHGFGMRTAIDF